MKRWRERGLLKPIASYSKLPYYDRIQLDEFMVEHVFNDDAIQILGIGYKALRGWIQNGRLEPVSGRRIDGCRRYLFRRKDLERLASEHRLTAHQLMKRLGMTHT